MIFAIGDLHLSFGLGNNKNMDKFGKLWDRHFEKIEDNWNKIVSENDTVLLAGDTSWAMSENEFIHDIKYIDCLKGKKIIISGNHDYWWNSTNRLNSLRENIFFLKRDTIKVEDTFICGTRGWIAPDNANFTKSDMKVYLREQQRLTYSLNKAVDSGAKDIIVMLHYPPFNDKLEPNEFATIINQFPVSTVVYGHLHGLGCEKSVNGIVDGIDYRLVSCDYLNFCPVKII